MNPAEQTRLRLTRREFFGRASTGIGTVALAHLLGRDGLQASTPPRAVSGFPGFAPKAKRVIYLFMNGGPTHVDLFDWKPKLKEIHGQPVPDSAISGQALQHHDRSRGWQADAGPGGAASSSTVRRARG
jgi:hypothetical protein